MTSIVDELKQLASVDLFKDGRTDGAFVGRPFHLDFGMLRILSNDKWKNQVGGVPAGAFLLCFYDSEPGTAEAILVRVLRPTRLPTDDDVVAAMVDYYKESLPSQSGGQKLDSYTRAEFQFSGLECRVIGTFYRTTDQGVRFAGDIDNFYAPNNYLVYKPTGKVLEYVVNFREGGLPGGKGDERIGVVRYSSSLRHGTRESVPVYVSPLDFLGKRTALFGMTRTGKSNTVKKIVQATVSISRSGVKFGGQTIQPAGQIVFDVNGEYANENQQDAGTAIFKQYSADVTRYSVIDKPGFRVMKLNFYTETVEGFNLLVSLLADDPADYTKAFCNIDWEKPDLTDYSASTRYARKMAAYKCCLYRAGFPSTSERVIFEANKEIISSTVAGLAGVDPAKGLSLEQATHWFTAAWENYREPTGPFEDYRRKNGREWADEDLQTLMRFLTRKSRPGGNPTESGYRKLIRARSLHTSTVQKPFEQEIVELLRAGKIVIMDLSQGDPIIQKTYSDRVCQRIFADAMERFIKNETTNFIQMYFEEAHNLFPRKDEQDLTIVYNRLAKEGQKLGLGICYATQEVSSISSAILKNTQNWFVSHLNNEDELKEVRKFYDFEDFTESLRRTTDRGFIRMKTDSNTFVVPVQIDRFQVEASG